MNVTIDDSINCLALFRDKAPENGFISSCIDLAICALKTVQDGNYQLKEEGNKYQEEIEKLANYDCSHGACGTCPYFAVDCEYMSYSCVSIQAQEVLRGHNDIRKELETWIQENY